MSLVEIKVPDIGDYKNIPVIEILVAPGDSVTAEDPLMTLESDKATMEVPAPMSGVVRELKVKIGDKVSEGVLVMTLETVAVAASTEAAATKPVSSTVAQVPAKLAAPVAATPVAPRTVVAAPFCPRIGRRYFQGGGKRAEEPYPARGRAGLCESRTGAASSRQWPRL